jgi:hypothetical protein
MVKMAQDEEFGGFNLSDKGFVLAPQLLWLKRYLEEYLGLLQWRHCHKTSVVRGPGSRAFEARPGP